MVVVVVAGIEPPSYIIYRHDRDPSPPPKSVCSTYARVGISRFSQNE